MTQISNKPDMISWKKFNYERDALVLRFQFQVQIPFEECYNMGIDLSIREQWDSKFYGYELLEVKQQGECTFYHCVRSPPFISDRDFIVHRKILQNYKGYGYLISLNSVEHPKKPIQRGKVRAKIINSLFCMNPLDGGKRTTISGYFETAIGGKIPNWVVNFISYQMPKEIKSEFESGYIKYAQQNLQKKGI